MRGFFAGFSFALRNINEVICFISIRKAGKSTQPSIVRNLAENLLVCCKLDSSRDFFYYGKIQNRKKDIYPFENVKSFAF